MLRGHGSCAHPSSYTYAVTITSLHLYQHYQSLYLEDTIVCGYRTFGYLCGNIIYVVILFVRIMRVVVRAHK